MLLAKQGQRAQSLARRVRRASVLLTEEMAVGCAQNQSRGKASTQTKGLGGLARRSPRGK
eukprot:7655204-Lingulodinium_polyedra.AAC.1